MGNFIYFLTPTEYKELAAKYAEEYGQDVKVPSLKEFQDMYEDIHQQAFRRMLPAMAEEEHITFKKICDKLKEFEWQALKKDYTECICLGIENDQRIEGVARQVERFLLNAGYEIEEEPKGPEEFVSSDFSELEKKPLIKREIKKREEDSEVFKVMKSFYKWLGEYIETRNNTAC